MAAPLSADQLIAALRAEGVQVREHEGWRTNNRNHKGAWGPVHGVMIHHTVTSGTASSVELCFNGHSSLPGPLCHGVIDKAGVVHLVGNGRANHAGAGDGDVLRAVINEQPLPPDNETDTDGNRHFYGFEAINLGDGKDPWPAAQLEAIERASAALCRAHGWSYRSVIRHLDWQPGKVDPRGVDWPAMQSRIAARLAGTRPTPTRPPAQEEPDMTPEQAKQLATAASQINTVYNERRLYSWGYKNTNVDPRDVYGVLTDIDKRVKALETTGLTDAQLTTLADKVAEALAARLAD